jgi:hypothetical protein
MNRIVYSNSWPAGPVVCFSNEDEVARITGTGWGLARGVLTSGYHRYTYRRKATFLKLRQRLILSNTEKVIVCKLLLDRFQKMGRITFPVHTEYKVKSQNIGLRRKLVNCFDKDGKLIFSGSQSVGLYGERGRFRINNGLDRKNLEALYLVMLANVHALRRRFFLGVFLIICLIAALVLAMVYPHTLARLLGN